MATHPSAPADTHYTHDYPVHVVLFATPLTQPPLIPYIPTHVLHHLAIGRWERVELTTNIYTSSAVRPALLFGLQTSSGLELPEVGEERSQAACTPVSNHSGLAHEG